MKKTAWFGLAVLVMVGFFGAPAVGDSAEPSPDEQDTIDAGALYQEHCAKCHGGDGRAKTFRGFVTFAQNLTNPHWQALVKDAHLSDAIKKGPGLMPGYDETFSQQEIEALVRFVRSLKVSEENSDQP